MDIRQPIIDRGILTIKSTGITLTDLYLQNRNKANAELNKLIREYNFNSQINNFNSDYVMLIDSFTYMKEDTLIQTNPFLFYVADFKVNKNKRIIKNKLNMDSNSVKEYTGMDDYNLNFSGFLINNDYNSKPVELLENFIVIMNAPVSLPIVCELLNRIDINNIVVDSFNFDSNYASKNTLPFSISASSDDPDYKIYVEK